MKKLSLLLAAILCLTAFAGLSALAENNDDMVVVATQFGQIRGDQVSDDLIIYKGVPYAAPPVGELRWKAPIDPEPWEGVLDCTEFNPMGMQVMDMECWWAEDLWYPWLDEYPNMSEDSLYLQIYSPAKSAADNVPVFVWIHGGASQHGVTYDAQAAAEELALLIDNLKLYLGALQSGDEAALKGLLREGRLRKEQLDKEKKIL